MKPFTAKASRNGTTCAPPGPSSPGMNSRSFPHPSVGFYDLLDESFLVRQHALAYQVRRHGLLLLLLQHRGQASAGKAAGAHPPQRGDPQRVLPLLGACQLVQQPGGQAGRLFAAGLRRRARRPAGGGSAALFRASPPPDGGGQAALPLLGPGASAARAHLCRYAARGRAQAGLPRPVPAGSGSLCGLTPRQWGLDGMLEFAPDWRPENQVSGPDEQPRPHGLCPYHCSSCAAKARAAVSAAALHLPRLGQHPRAAAATG